MIFQETFMKELNVIKYMAVVAGACLLAAGCAVEVGGPRAEVAVATPGVVYVDTAPPAVIAETPPPMPGTGFIWVGGGWLWEGGRWRWEAGRWDRPPRPGMRWVAHRYEYRGGRRVFVRGGWR
jgi:hypothetical protein